MQRGLLVFALIAVVMVAVGHADEATPAAATTTTPATETAGNTGNAPGTITPNVEAVKQEAEKLAALDAKLDEEDDFPPPKELTEEEIKQAQAWAGHMKPLASANTKVAAVELTSIPSAVEFFEQYVVKSVPVILRGAGNDLPAISKWTDEYLGGVAGANETRVVAELGKKEDRNRTEESVYPTFTEFITNYTKQDIYLIHDMLPSIKADVLVPQVLDCPAILPTLTRALMHMSNGGTKSVLHHEHYDDIHCIIDGSKSFLLVDPAKNKEHLVIDSDDPETGEYIAVDVDAVDATKYPGMPKVEFVEAVVNKGDCIYIPAVWLQADTTTPQRHVGVSVWWQRDTESDAKIKECPATTPSTTPIDQRTPLSNVTLLDEQRYNHEKHEADLDFEKAAQEAENDLISLISEDPEAAEKFAKKLMEEIKAEGLDGLGGDGKDDGTTATTTSAPTTPKGKDEL